MSHVREGNVTPEFARLMVHLSDCFAGHRLSDGVIRMYAEQLADLTLDEIRGAMKQAVAVEKFFPAIATLRQYVFGSVEDAALIAWTALGNAASAAGAYSSVDIEDGAAADAIETVFGSWSAFCEIPDGPALALKRQEFLAAYRAARRRSAGPRRLIGLCAPGELAPHTWRLAVARTGQLQPVRDDPAAALAAAPVTNLLTSGRDADGR